MYFYHVCTNDFKKSNWKPNTFHTEIYSIQSSWLDRVHPKSEFAHFCLLYKILFQLQQVVWVAVQVHSHNTIEVKDQFNNLYWLTDHSNLWNERDRLISTMTTTIKLTHARRFFSIAPVLNVWHQNRLEKNIKPKTTHISWNRNEFQYWC